VTVLVSSVVLSVVTSVVFIVLIVVPSVIPSVVTSVVQSVVSSVVPSVVQSTVSSVVQSTVSSVVKSDVPLLSGTKHLTPAICFDAHFEPSEYEHSMIEDSFPEQLTLEKENCSDSVNCPKCGPLKVDSAYA